MKSHSEIGRRAFLAQAAAASVACAHPGLFAQAAPPDRKHGFPPTLGREELSAQLRKLFVPNSPELDRFAVEVYSTCVLDKLMAPDPPLAHAWLVPGGGYRAQWLWDTMFVLDLLSALPGQEAIIRGVFQNYWDFQKRWNAVKPRFMHDMVPNFIAPFSVKGRRDGSNWRTHPAYSQIPLLAWGMERVYLRNHDKELLRAGLVRLENFHEWYWRERDVTEIGMVGVGSYSGIVQDARYETYDHERDLDDVRLTPHPGRPAGVDNGVWYGDIAIPSITSYLLIAELSLVRMAAILGDHAMALRRRARYERGAAAMRRHMWDDKAGCFVAVRTGTLEKIPSISVGGFVPLAAGVPSLEQGAIMAAALGTPAWATPLPVPSMAATDPLYSAGTFWRGDVWPALDYQIASGLAAYGHAGIAARIADAMLGNAIKVGISERYDSISGAPYGVAGLGMSGSAFTLALDGLTSERYRVRLRNARS